MIASANNISASYTLDTGQTDNYYGHSSISLKPGSPAPTGQIVIVYDRFTHPGSAGFFSANSYDTVVQAGTVYNGGLNNFKYSDIPSYTSPVSGETYKLTDVVDFRPLVQDNTPSTTYDIATNIDAVLSTTIKNPDSDTTSILDYSYYLPRIDKLVLTRDRQFEVIRGKADTNPVAPSIESILNASLTEELVKKSTDSRVSNIISGFCFILSPPLLSYKMFLHVIHNRCFYIDCH